MSDPGTHHPSADRLAAHALGLLSDADRQKVSEHLRQCLSCSQLLEALPGNKLVALARTRITPPPRDEPEQVAAPASVKAELPTTLPHRASPPLSGDSSGRGPGGSKLPAGLVDHPRYEVLQLLGSGGMGVVYKARHRLMDRLVALKVIHPKLVTRPGMEERFTREVKAAARLSHPNIVAAYDAEQRDGTHFLVMEFVDGTDLEKVAGALGPLPMELACEYTRQAALGLQHALTRNMVHRDIKPHNLMLTPEGRIKILDFGLARFVSETMPEALAGETEGSPYGLCRRAGVAVTATNAAGGGSGTVDYMAPEEARDARRADVRADIYSLGCTLYRFLAGRVPFPGGTWEEKAHAHANRAPRALADVRPDLPATLCGVVEAMMAKDPAERPQTPADVARALAPFAAASYHVLVVDDSPAIQRALSKILGSQGYAVTLADNGRQALDRLHAGLRPGVILLDLMMPVMDGWEFLREVRQDPELASIPTILVTAADESQAEEVARGAAGYLQKPIDLQELSAQVHHHAGRP